METTDSVQDYLKAIYALMEGGGEVTTSAIAGRLRVSPASVTAMLKRLAERGHVRYRRYRGVELTESGRSLALEVIRHHRLLEAYLYQSLGLSWDKIHDEAEVLEHVLSEDLEDRISEVLGHPTHDPHGDPIPPKSGALDAPRHNPLGKTSPGPARVERVSDQDPAALRFLAKMGLKPGADITVLEHSPYTGGIWIRVGRKRHAISEQLADQIFVSARTA